MINQFMDNIKGKFGSDQPRRDGNHDQISNDAYFLEDQQDEYFRKMGEFEPIKMAERGRDQNMPTGLKNIGNSK